jgi:glycosyltransferase involved in cell wall biosynthesis
VFVGDGPDRTLLEALIRDMKDMAPPILVGYQADTASFYGIFDVFVPNSFAEGMSNTLMEAMSSGLAIVCTSVGRNVELVEGGECGNHAPPGDDEALARRIAEYPGSRSSHGMNARQFVEQILSLEAMVERYSRLVAANR